MMGPRAGRRPPTVAAISLGCPKNLVDTEVMLGLLREAGFSPVTDPRGADVLLVNTCCFIEAARTESAETLTEAAALRRNREVKALICAGCWPERDCPQLRAEFPEVDAFVGPGDVPDIVAAVRRALDGDGAKAPSAPASAYLYDEATPRLRATPPWTAYLKIAEGCSHQCRFCVIPRLRGRYRSRPLESVVTEARRLASEGVLEINLVAQDSTAYGRDLDGADTAALLVALAEVDGLRWIRLMYAHPTGVTERLIEAMAGLPKVCHYLDVPFQHADSGVLRKMGRAGDGDTYLKQVERLRQAMPDIAIRTSFLVGHPGEDETAFGRLLGFLKAAQLDRVGAFRFSPEAGTPAAREPDAVPEEQAEERYHRLMAAQQPISLARNERWIGRELDALIEARGSAGGEWVGRSFRDAPEIDGSVLVRAGGRGLAPGEFARVLVTAAGPYDLIAHPAGGKPRSKTRRPSLR